MPLVATQEGCSAMWQQLLGLYAIGAPMVRLLGQAHAPLHTDTLATFAALEVQGNGYSPIQLANPFPNWQVTQLPNGAQAAYPVLTWSFTGPVTVFGYWSNDASATFSLWAEAFAQPFVYGASGGPFQLILPLTLTSQP